MRKFSSLLFILLLLLVGCSQELDVTPVQPQGESVKAHVSLKVAPMTIHYVNTPPATTKSFDPALVDENQISDLWVAQYDRGTGAFIRKYYVDDVSATSVEILLAPTLSGSSNLYFMANLGPVLKTSYTEAEFLKQVKDINTESDILINGKAISGVTKRNLPMFGKKENMVVPAGGTLDALTVELTKMVARIDITYTVPTTLAADFNLEKVRICNVPSGIQLAPSAVATSTPTTTVPVQNYEPMALTAITGTNTVTFYVPENQKGEGSNTAKTEQRFKSGIPDATYVEFMGHTTGIQGGEEVGYCVYLGKDIYNDYNVTRNVKYATTVTLADISPSDQRVKYHSANCYLLKPGGTITVPVVTANYSDLGIQIPDVTKNWSAGVYWQTVSGLVTVSTATMSKGYFTVTAPSNALEGNAIVFVKDPTTTNSSILWSWHIWVTNDDINRVDFQETVNGYTFMDRNLGATERCSPMNSNVKWGYQYCGGFYYQWGRKDPFIGTAELNKANPIINNMWDGTNDLVPPATYALPETSSITVTKATNNKYIYYADASATPISYSNQLLVATRFPLLFLNNWTGSTATTASNGENSWGGEFNQPKSPYDPCPEGWRVPSGKYKGTVISPPWGSTVTGSGFPSASLKNGEAFYMSNGALSGTYYAFPATGNIQANYTFFEVGIAGGVWTATLAYAGSTSAKTLYYSSTVTPQTDRIRDKAYQIRCVKQP